MSTTEALSTRRLALSPLDVADAFDMVHVLSDPALYIFTGGEPLTLAELEDQYRRQSDGPSWEGEIWHNWIMRVDGSAIGFVQATVRGESAELAWVVGVPWQGAGYATEASQAVKDWLTGCGVERFSAHIHPDHRASQTLATRLGLQPTGQLDDEGEMIWS